jgi:hypothetical protein
MNIIQDVPDSLYKAICNDKYDKGEADYTPSSLNSPAYQKRLFHDFEDQLEEKASQAIWRLLGTAVHYIAELGAEQHDHIESERRFYGTIATKYGDKKIGAQVDVFDHSKNAIEDYKCTSVWSHGKAKDEWIQQLNVGRWCVYEETGKVVEKLTIICIYRDWSARDAMMKPDYPKSQVALVDIPLWTHAQCEAWIREKVEEREAAMQAPTINDVIPCSDEDTWAKPTKYAVMKIGGSRATKVFESRASADEFAKSKGSDFYVDIRHGERTRCKGYCAGCKVCPAYQSHLKSTGK